MGVQQTDVLIRQDADRRLSHDLRGLLGNIHGFVDLIRDGKAGPVSAHQRELLDDALAAAGQLRARLAGALDWPEAGPTEAPAPAVARVAAPPASAVAEPAAAVSRPEGARRILVVEDDPRDGGDLERMLRAAGYEVDVARTGRDAVERSRARRYDGVTLDLLLPDMTGWEVLRELRRGLNADVPVVVVSATPTKVAVTGYVVRTVLAKPASSEALLQALRDAGVPPGAAGPILVVDDNPTALKLARALLERHGYRCVCRPDGESGLRAAAEALPAAVLLDLVMPGMDGFEFLRRFRRLPVGQDTPVVVWTIRDLSPADREALAGTEAIVGKREGGTRGLLAAVQQAAGARAGGREPSEVAS